MVDILDLIRLRNIRENEKENYNAKKLQYSCGVQGIFSK